MKAVYKKELSYYLNTPVGYIVTGLFAAFANFLFLKDIFIIGSASLRPFFETLPWLLLIFVPAISMRVFAEEKRSNTIETLLMLPLSEMQIVMAKFFALLTLVGVGLLLTVAAPLSFVVLAKLYLPEVVAGYAGVLLLAGLYISLSIFFSAQTKNQVVALLLSVLVIFLLLVVSTQFAASIMPKFVQDFISYFSPLYHQESFTKGIFDIRSIMYFLGFTGLFLFLTITDLERRD